jgi:hypothetical protein
VPTEPADALASLDGNPFEGRYSQGARAEAVRLADLAKEAYAYFARIFSGASPRLASVPHPRRLDGRLWHAFVCPIEKQLRVATVDIGFGSRLARSRA